LASRVLRELNKEVQMQDARQQPDRLEGGPKVIDGYLTTGSSPGDPVTVHLLGLGSVGRELVRRIPESKFRLVGLSDRSGTHVPRSHADALRAAERKAAGSPLGDSPGTLAISLPDALSRTSADIVVDATHTDLGREAWPDFLHDSVLRPGRCLALASKDALCWKGHVWAVEFGSERVRFNAVLGGTGASFATDLPLLRSQVRDLAIAGNASTTAIVETIERGGDLQEGIAEARRLGLLELDPELDLRGVDAATKLAIVVALLTGLPVDPQEVSNPDIREVGVEVIQRRRASGSTTRLVGRYSVGGRPLLRFEELPLGHPLAVPRDTVVYRYRLTTGEYVEHCGKGLGAGATADAVLADLAAFSTSLAAEGDAR
jgi:homoserine dehydrogenase